MPIYEYKALDAGSKTLAGTVTADSPSDARRKLRDQDLYVTELREVRQDAGRSTGLLKTKPNYELALLTRQFATLLSTGLPIVEALAALVEQTDSRKLQRALRDVRQRVTEGTSLPDALAAHPRFFDNLYVSMVRAGESGGNLDTVLARLADYLSRQNRVRSRLATALTYPAIVATLGLTVVVFLLTFVLPKIVTALQEQGKALPLPTEIMMTASRVLAGYWWLIAGIVAAVVIASRGALASERGRYLWDAFKLRMPLFGPLIRKQSASHFSSTLSSLLAAGIPALEALKVVKDVVANRVLAQAIEDVRKSVMEGTNISTPIKKSKVFPPIVGYMIAVGEESGKLEDMLSRLSEAYEEEIEMSSQRLISVLEPLVIVVLGAFVAFVAVSILLPILKAAKLGG